MSLQFLGGLVLAALTQAGIIILGETVGLTRLNMRLDTMQLVNHVLTGILAGYLFAYLLRTFDVLRAANPYIIGAVYGVLLWLPVLTVASLQGKVVPP